MDFIRKNWSRLSLAFLFFIGGVITMIAWINYPGSIVGDYWLSSFYNIALLISTILFFFGMVGVTVVKSLPNSKKIVSIIYMSMGAIITVLLLIFIMVASCNDGSNLILFTGDFATYALYKIWVPLIVFGLYPLIKGVTRFIEAEAVPARAAVQPTATAPVQPEVTETAPAAAPKAPAKKAAPQKPAAK